MVSIISRNSSLLKSEDMNLVSDMSHYSILESLFIEENSTIESLPPLYYSETTKTGEDTEDDDEEENNPPKPMVEKTPPASTMAALPSSESPIEAYSSHAVYNYPLSTASIRSTTAVQNPTLVSSKTLLNSSSSTQIMNIPSPQPSQSSSRLMNALYRFRSVNKHQGVTNSVAPADFKMTPSRSLADKIKSKFHPQRNLAESTQKVPFENINTLSLTKSISSHRLYKEQPRRPAPRYQAAAQPPQKQTRKRGVRFAKVVSVKETYSKLEYDRASDPEAVCSRLTPMIAQQIKEELNAYKLYEMQIHESSKPHTHFFN